MKKKRGRKMNKLLKKAIGLTMAAAIAVPVGMGTGTITGLSGITVHAASWLDVSNVVVTGYTANTITVSWQGDANADSYEVTYQETYGSSSEYKVAGQTTGTTYTISGLKSGEVYSIRVTPRNAAGTEAFAGTCYNARTKVSAMRGVKQDTWYHWALSAMVSWDRQYGADGYEYKWKNPSGKVTKKGKTTYTSLTFSIKNNNVYQFMVRAYQKIDGKTYYSSWKTIQVFEQPWVKSVAVKTNKKSKKCLKISWYKQKGATGYDVYVAKKNNPKNYKKVKSVGKNKTSISITKFNKKNIKGTYYVYVVSKVKTSSGTSKSGVSYIWQTGQSTEGYIR